MIVVFPDIYASDTQDKCDGLDAKNNAAYDNFINLLTKEIMPYMEQSFTNFYLEQKQEFDVKVEFSQAAQEFM